MTDDEKRAADAYFADNAKRRDQAQRALEIVRALAELDPYATRDDEQTCSFCGAEWYLSHRHIDPCVHRRAVELLREIDGGEG